MSGTNGSDTAATKDIMIQIEDLWKTYQMGTEEIHALSGVSFKSNDVDRVFSLDTVNE